MTNVALFPSVLGVRPGIQDAAERLRHHGHDVLVADLYAGRTFDDYAPAMAFAWEELGLHELMGRGLAAAADVPDGFVSIGYSLGCILAVHVATERPVSGVVMVAGAAPVSAIGEGRRWPVGVPAQTHATVGDPWREAEEVAQTVRDVVAGGGVIEVFDYPGSGHLFDDRSLPGEYDGDAAEALWSRVLPFVQACGDGRPGAVG